MKAAFLNPFVEAVFSVVPQVLSVTPKRGELSLRHAKTFTSEDVNAVVGVRGEVQGVAVYGFSKETALTIVSTMTGSPYTEFDDMSRSAINELANMITGNAATLLSNAGYKCDISPPSLVQGTGIQVTTLAPALLVPFETELGPIQLNVALVETAAKAA